jgi:maltooligosyltrehalose trehalohydrolase
VPWRRLPVGAEAQPGGGVHFRVWAPARQQVEVLIEAAPSAAAAPAGAATPAGGSTPALLGLLALDAEPGGYFSGLMTEAAGGDLYRFRLDGGESYPDPASRFQPGGPHGPSQVVDPAAYRWADDQWHGAAERGLVLYEMHLGTFTRAGTWAAAEAELGELAGLGVTVLELMPVADFPGRFGWGYDGVDLFAPCRLYGQPDDFRRFVDRAHAAGLAVILDVVYNHLGPDGNNLKQFAPAYFTGRHETDWGEALNFYGPGSPAVRELIIANAGYWIDEFHLDGLRLDATQGIHDRSRRHLLAAIGRRAREAAAKLSPPRRLYLVAENEPQETRLVHPLEQGGYGLDALWNDDFHHAAMVALTGRREAYYTDYRGTPQELLSAVKHGYLYQGQRYAWQGKRRGTPSRGLRPAAFVAYLQNHDQIANAGSGERCHRLTSPGRLRALTALLLLGPATPLLFQGQEFCASSPFLYFADHHPDLARAVRRGRAEFLSQFPSLRAAAAAGTLPDPADPRTWERSRLDLDERHRHAAAYRLHRDLLSLRRLDPVFGDEGAAGVDGAVLGPQALVLRFFSPHDRDRLLLLNLGCDLDLVPAPEPLLAPPRKSRWEVLWASEEPCYGGGGMRAPEDPQGGWCLQGEAAIVLMAVPALRGSPEAPSLTAARTHEAHEEQES